MITRKEVLMGRDKIYPLTPELEFNLTYILLPRLNQFRSVYNKPMIITSGYRPKELNQTIKNASSTSLHQVLLACDFKDTNGELDKFCMNNLSLLEEWGLWLEHPDHTPGWCHLQCSAPKSKVRVFNI